MTVGRTGGAGGVTEDAARYDTRPCAPSRAPEVSPRPSRYPQWKIDLFRAWQAERQRNYQRIRDPGA
jgi:hypothetical protein